MIAHRVFVSNVQPLRRGCPLLQIGRVDSRYVAPIGNVQLAHGVMAALQKARAETAAVDVARPNVELQFESRRIRRDIRNARNEIKENRRGYLARNRQFRIFHRQIIVLVALGIRHVDRDRLARFKVSHVLDFDALAVLRYPAKVVIAGVL